LPQLFLNRKTTMRRAMMIAACAVIATTAHADGFTDQYRALQQYEYEMAVARAALDDDGAACLAIAKEQRGSCWPDAVRRFYARVPQIVDRFCIATGGTMPNGGKYDICKHSPTRAPVTTAPTSATAPVSPAVIAPAPVAPAAAEPAWMTRTRICNQRAHDGGDYMKCLRDKS
jgi:hypothetical protein